ncbi:MAG: conjugative transposon protein TraM [Cytophaga sp.]|nr:conjugative transposon protein TraM [Cytophaga sp.]
MSDLIRSISFNVNSIVSTHPSSPFNHRLMQHSEKFIQKRRLFIVLPLLCLPFITLFFWALGGGQGNTAQAAVKPAGLNMELPDAYFNAQEKWDKLSIYERSTRDSMERDDQLTLEPYFELAALKETHQQDTVRRHLQNRPAASRLTTTAQASSGKTDPMEEKVNKKLEQLYQQLNTPPAVSIPSPVPMAPSPATEPAITSTQIEQLESIMQSMKEPGTPDPEMEQIQNVLEKILDIQHPERVKERLQQQQGAQERKTYRVANSNGTPIISEMGVPDARSRFDTVPYKVSTLPRVDFYGLEQEALPSEPDNAIPAVIHDTQEVVSGTTIRLRLTREVTLNGHLIPKDEYIYGTCTISGERLMISITSMRHENSIYPVALTAYGMDGLQGVPVPGAISRDVAKQSSNQAIQGVPMMGMDPALEIQAASLGVETAKGFFSRKTQLVKATVKAEDPLLLKDTGLLH